VTEQIQRLLDPQFVSGLGARSLDELRAMKSDAVDVENALSYLRRLAQGRMEILNAETDRRARGGNVSDLVKDLPRILSGDSVRPSIVDTRVPPPSTPEVRLRWPDGREALVEDTTLANLPLVADDELGVTLARLADFERELSDLRRQMHGVIDTLEREIATRQVAGTAG
jgi:hypothetical protein